METTRRNFLRGLIATTALPLLPSIAFSMPRSISHSTEDKWIGSVLGPDGKIYCVPNESPDVLIISDFQYFSVSVI